MKDYISKNPIQTRKIGSLLAKEILNSCYPPRQGRIICLSGNLGSGKTTFVQGFLKELKIKGPYTSPTFVIMKHYQTRETHNANRKSLNTKHKALRAMRCALRDIFHIDAYRIKSNDLLALGWKEIINDKNNIMLIEWAERVKKIIPQGALWIKFKWISENERAIIFSGLLPKTKLYAKNT